MLYRVCSSHSHFIIRKVLCELSRLSSVNRQSMNSSYKALDDRLPDEPLVPCRDPDAEFEKKRSRGEVQSDINFPERYSLSLKLSVSLTMLALLPVARITSKP